MGSAEAAAAQWWAGRFKQVIALENSLDAKQATVKLLQAVMPNLGTLLVYIMITKLISEASNSAILNAPNVGQQLGFLAAFGTFIGGIAGLAGLLSGAFDLPIIYERFRPMLDANVDVFDPWASDDQCFAQHQLRLISELQENFYDAVLIAVAHDKFREMGINSIRSFCKETSVIYDLKYMFSANLTDARL